MITILVIALWVGILGSGAHYWFTRGRDEEFLVGRLKTVLVMGFFPLYWFAKLVRN